MAEQTRRVVKRVAKKTAAPKKAARPAAAPEAVANPWEGTLDPGDKIEFGVSAEIVDKKGRKYWPRAGVTVTLRQGESVAQAKDRAAAFVHGFVDEQAREFFQS